MGIDAFGAYPAVSLSAARSKRDEARKLLADGKDPSVKRKLDKIAAATATQNTFGAIAAECLANTEANGASEATLSKNRWLLEEKEQMTPHGFRSAASTILNERGFNPDVIEAALTHQDEDDVRRAYNRATYWPERIKLLQAWADMLDEFQKVSVHNRHAA